MTANPYQSPSAESYVLPVNMILVEGKQFVCGDGMVLPARCVKTNEPLTDKEMKKHDFYWCTPVIAVAILLSPLIVILLYFILRKKCTLTFGVSAALRKRRRKVVLVKCLLALGLFIAMPFAAGTDSTPLIVTTIILFLIAVIAIFVGNSWLRVTSFRDKKFSFRGASPEFLQSLMA